MRRFAGAGILVALVGTMLTAQEQAQPNQEQDQLGGILQDVNLHDLTLAVQRITGKTLLWTEDLGLRRQPARCRGAPG